MVQLGIGIIGSIAHHPLLQYAIEELRKTYQEKQIIIVKTGPIFFTRLLVKYADKLGVYDCVLPASYFYPCGYEQRGTSKEKWCRNESSAVHHWAGSWLKPEAFVRS